MRDDIRATIAANISRYGQHLASVHADEDSPSDFEPFIYTIGNHELGMPELLFVGANGDLQGNILNILGQLQRGRGYALTVGEIADFTARFPALILDAGPRGRDEFAIQVGVYYGIENFEVYQVLLPDQNGKYPGDPECLPPYSEQPLLFVRH